MKLPNLFFSLILLSGPIGIAQSPEGGPSITDPLQLDPGGWCPDGWIDQDAVWHCGGAGSGNSGTNGAGVSFTCTGVTCSYNCSFSFYKDQKCWFKGMEPPYACNMEGVYHGHAAIAQ